MSYSVPRGWYEQDEISVTSWVDLKTRVAFVLSKNPDRQWVWRGQPDSELPLTSSLYRKLSSHEDGVAKIPTESEIQAAESRILSEARSRFRMGSVNALELFAQLQHLGAPTRFIDITRNPYVAIWFACQDMDSTANKDGRVFSFGVPLNDESVLDFSEATYSGEPFWFDNQDNDWGHGKPKVWFPPFGTHQRVFAQNAGFIFDGAPVFGAGSNSNYIKRDKNGKAVANWSKDSIIKATSIHLNFVRWSRKVRTDSQMVPVYTLRIPHKMKHLCLREMEREFGLQESTIFPGIEGLAHLLSRRTKNSL